ncbi:MAG: C10 family peptidase [Candidatus Stygibacter australis]|nr:C10 family peptidase [Candidatus Stygibacter australis]MDP8321068.1 C10 family peptidase [Candidatus Stygibacter australis]
MKKHLIIGIFLIIFTSALLASPVTIDEATLVAQGKLTLSENSCQIDSVNPITNEDNQNIAWAFDLSPVGFIIVNCDTDIVPIYAYSFRNSFSLEEVQQNTALMMLKEDIKLRKSAIDVTDPAIIQDNNLTWQAYLNNDLQSLISRDRSVFPPSSYNTPTGGWVVTQWDQGHPWNQFCPMDPDSGGRSVVGCVATAFAQVVNYHREIGDLMFDDDDDYVSDNYTSPVYLDDDWDTYNFLNFPDLNVYMDELRDNYANGLNFTNTLKGALSFACGILTEMQYSNSGSGTQTLYSGYAFSNRLGYDSVLNVYNIGNDFYTILSDDMVNGRPAMISILGGPEGHCIIVDGWNSDTDYYHLNMGWNGNSDGWYSLPEGMPAGYNVIREAVCNIEGGTVPVDILGFVNAYGENVNGTEITLDGAVDYICTTDETGMFNLAFVHEGWYDVTATLALLDGGYYYHQQQEYIDATNTFLQIDMDNYEFIDGNVTAPVDPSGTNIAIYQNNTLVSEAEVAADGSYQTAGLLPGSYVLVASLPSHYGRVRHINVSLEEQTYNFELFDYQQSSNFSYASEPEDIWHLIATTMSVAIKLTDDELADMEEALISKVIFKSPIAPEDGQLWAQVWQNETLISETEISDFSYEEELEIDLNNFAIVEQGNEYFVGYKIQSSNADLAWHDAGPRVPGKGAWFRINSWTELPVASDVNLCIEAVILHPMLDETSDNVPPQIIILQQNYPNPFNPETTINFNLPSTDFASLIVYNIKGEKVATLAAEALSAGDHIYIWQGKDDNNLPVSSGIYFYQLVTSQQTETRKMILLK